LVGDVGGVADRVDHRVQRALADRQRGAHDVAGRRVEDRDGNAGAEVGHEHTTGALVDGDAQSAPADPHGVGQRQLARVGIDAERRHRAIVSALHGALTDRIELVVLGRVGQ